MLTIIILIVGILITLYLMGRACIEREFSFFCFMLVCFSLFLTGLVHQLTTNSCESVTEVSISAKELVRLQSIEAEFNSIAIDKE